VLSIAGVRSDYFVPCVWGFGAGLLRRTLASLGDSFPRLGIDSASAAVEACAAFIGELVPGLCGVLRSLEARAAEGLCHEVVACCADSLGEAALAFPDLQLQLRSLVAS
jgi:hypothetical protein